MPLPHFLILILAVILAAALTLWIASASGVPLMAMALVILMAAGIAHFAMREDH
ncbi:hypothetical protein [Paracoccus shanxieyensis]|uniref:hypothetical protein n=1 Tax=Paracoccus shanxieyensis TaxID=2675752 RepID=UPI0018ACF2F6|nr:hypothetical protein [Paracoccus shanxieyensis]